MLGRVTQKWAPVLGATHKQSDSATKRIQRLVTKASPKQKEQGTGPCYFLGGRIGSLVRAWR